MGLNEYELYIFLDFLIKSCRELENKKSLDKNPSHYFIFPSSKSSASLDTIIGIIPIDDEVNHSVLVTKQRSNEETGYATPEVHCTVFLPLAFESESLCVFSIFSRFQNLKMHFIAQVPQCATVHCCIKVKVALVIVLGWCSKCLISIIY